MNLLTLDQSLEVLKIGIKDKQIILFTDFDGTLLPIQSDPKNIFLSEETKTLLSVLSRTIPFTIISGRSLNDLKEKIAIPEINLSGNHGLEIEGPVGFYLNTEAILSYHTITKLSSLFREGFQSEPGVYIEDKVLTVSIHYNLIPAKRHSEIVKAVSLFLRPYPEYNEIRVTQGKNVIEIRPPVKWGKAEAIRWILDRYKSLNPEKEYFPLYAGDDETDMNALSFVNCHGFAIWVGDPKAKVRASAFVPSSWEMVDFLFWLNYFLKEQASR